MAKAAPLTFTLELIMSLSMAISIVLAVATGLSVIAFKMPRIYLRMVWPLLGLMVLVQMLAIAWKDGFSRARNVLIEFIPKETAANAWKLLDAESISSDFFIYMFVAMLFIGFLNWLAYEVIEHTDSNAPKQPVNDE